MPIESVEDNIKALIQVQNADHAIDELARERQMALDAIQLAENQLKANQQKLEDDRKTLQDLQKQQRTLEIETASLDTKSAKYQTQLFEVKSNKDYDALKAEIEHAKAEKAKIEDRILDVLFHQDEQKKKIEVLNRQVEDDKKRTAADKQTLLAKAEACEKTAEGKRKESETVLAEIDHDWSDAYRQLRKSGKKTALAEITEEKMCSGCRMSVPPQTIIEVRRANQPIRCSCGRLLYVKD